MEERLLSKREGIGENKSIGVSDRRLYSFPIHTHDYCEIELVLSGSGAELLGNKKIPLERGSVSILTPADCHSVESECGLLIRNISFCEESVPDRLRDKLYGLASYSGKLDEADIDRLCRAGELLALDGESRERAGCILEYLLSLFPEAASRSGRDPVNIARVFADAHFRDNPSVADGARVACLSPVYFGALFKRRIGMSFGAYVNKKKLTFALALLEGGVGVAEACFESGFGSVSNFSKAFRAEYGRSPGEYRRGADT